MCRYRESGDVLYHFKQGAFSVYLTCAYVAIQMFGGGTLCHGTPADMRYDDVAGTGSISPQNDVESLVAFVCVVLGTMLWAIFTGAVCSVQTNLDPAEQVCPLAPSMPFHALRCPSMTPTPLSVSRSISRPSTGSII